MPPKCIIPSAFKCSFGATRLDTVLPTWAAAEEELLIPNSYIPTVEFFAGPSGALDSGL